MVGRVDLDRLKPSWHPVDDDFDSRVLDPKWIVLSGTPGTVNPRATGGGVYDLTSRPGWLLGQADTSGNRINLRQDYELASGESIVVAVAVGITADGTSGIADGHMGCGITLNTDDDPQNRVTINVDAESNGWRVYTDRHIGGTEDMRHWVPQADAPFPPAIARRIYLRVLRDSLDYYCMWSVDGGAWFQFQAKPMPAAMDSFRIFIDAPSAPDPTPIAGFDFVRIGGSGIDPW